MFSLTFFKAPSTPPALKSGASAVAFRFELFYHNLSNKKEKYLIF